MSYIGRGIDQIDNISTLDNLSFNGVLQTFNLTQNSVAFVPVSADALQIQIDGVIQSGNYTVSGSTVENAPSNDDGLVYETGTYTAEVGNGVTNATYATSTNTCRYVRIGEIVHVNVRVITSAIGSGISDYFYFTLPFGHTAS